MLQHTAQDKPQNKNLPLYLYYMVTINISRTQADYGFEAVDEAGKIVHMDTSPDGGGNDYGIRPMQALLMALGGCSGIDIVSILKKQRQEFTNIKMIISGEREQNKIPALWEKVHVHFQIIGNVDAEKAKHAASLSIEKYCSVAETLRRSGCTITWDIEVTN
jgi:putative redox protein